MLHLGTAVIRLVMLGVLFFFRFGVGGSGLVFVYKRAWDPRWIVYCVTHIISHPVSFLVIELFGLVLMLMSDLTDDISCRF